MTAGYIPLRPYAERLLQSSGFTSHLTPGRRGDCRGGRRRAMARPRYRRRRAAHSRMRMVYLARLAYCCGWKPGSGVAMPAGSPEVPHYFQMESPRPYAPSRAEAAVVRAAGVVAERGASRLDPGRKNRRQVTRSVSSAARDVPLKRGIPLENGRRPRLDRSSFRAARHMMPCHPAIFAGWPCLGNTAQICPELIG
jgi:hypothetical protein